MNNEGKLPLNQIICGNTLDVLRKFPSDSVDCVMTSPPYWGLRDYGEETSIIWSGNANCQHQWGEKNDPIHDGQVSQTKYGKRPSSSEGGNSDTGCFCINCGAWKGKLGLEPEPILFIKHLVEIFREIKRVMKPSGTFWLNMGDTYFGGGGNSSKYNRGPNSCIPQNTKELFPEVSITNQKGDGKWLQPKQKLLIPERVAIAMQEDGWILRNDVVWFKPNHMPQSVRDRLSNGWEHVYLFVKNNKYWFDLDTIRKPLAESSIKRITEPNVLNQKGGMKQDVLRGNPESGNASWCNKMVQNLAKSHQDNARTQRKQDNVPGKNARIYEGFNDRYDDNDPNRLGANPGDVWPICTYPFKDAHFAVFPPKLVEICLKAGCSTQVCSKCGKSRTRIVERHSHYTKREVTHTPLHAPTKVDSSGWKPPTLRMGDWNDCGCGQGFDGGVVLDPFCGSGTALLVAKRMKLNYIGIDIKPEYVEMATKRLSAIGGLDDYTVNQDV